MAPAALPPPRAPGVAPRVPDVGPAI